MKVRLGKKTTQFISRINKINGWENRAVYGIAALATQPFFDYNNPSVDKTTQKYSLVQTLTKIIVGTAVGVASRAAFQKYGQHLFRKGTFDVEKLGIKNFDKKRFESCFGNTFAVLGAIGAMCSIDILISNHLLTHFNKKLKMRSKNDAI